LSEQTTAAPAAIEPAPVSSAPNLDSGESFTAEQAFEAYQKRNSSPAESAETATAGDKELAVEADAGPEEVPSETQQVDPEDNLPSIEPPRSWTKEEKEAFKAYPRDAQALISAQVARHEASFLRSQNETAEKLKALTAKEQQAEQAKQEYLNKVPTLEDIQRYVAQGPFADIKTQDDADALAQNDPFRYLQWDSYQKRLAVVANQATQAQQLKAQERQGKRASYEAEQNKLLVELVPEMADPTKASELRTRAVAMLNDDVGLKNDQLSKWMADDIGHEILSSAGIQKLIADRLEFMKIKAAPPKAIPRPVPNVQRPGIGRAPGASNADAIQATRNKLSGTGSLEDAFALYQAKKSRAR
jgi:hypothetical protein